MTAPDQKVKCDEAGAERFRTTHWAMVIAAGRRSSPDARAALEALCQTYWYPLYAYVRRLGHSADDAQDLTQAFFSELLEKNIAGKADRERGKFRSFLLASLKHFMARQWRRAGALKRGSRRVFVSLDLAAGEKRYVLEPIDALTAETIYQRRWALTLLEQAIAKVRDEFAASGKAELFDQLKTYLGGDENTVPYGQLAADLGKTEGAIKVAVHRLRKRCRDVLRAEIAGTVSDRAEVDEELRDLFEAVSL
jgi:RNA polymerase sigma-70 factor (ECF subfamily)